MAKEEKFVSLAKEAYTAMDKARIEAIGYITRIVKKHGGEIKFDFNYDDEDITVMYDGGNNPEYARWNTVSGLVYNEENDDVYVDIEDCNEYEFDRMSTDDILTVAKAIYYSADKRLKKEGK